jgi:hypothetical protein
MKISLITEGDIDRALIPCLLAEIAKRVGVTWPLTVDEFQETQIRKRGFGAVLDGVRLVIEQMEAGTYARPDVLVVVLDHRKTQAVVDEIRRLTRSMDWIAIGIAVEEIEAWWLADQNQVLAWLEISREDARRVGYSESYSPERDHDPKQTLHLLTQASNKILFNYGRGSVTLAEEFADVAWKNWADLESMVFKCPRGFAPFAERMRSLLRT